MARPRSFDPDDVLDIAREVFWEKGFQKTSLDDITTASGIAKPSLYAAFGSKTTLFLRVIDRYHAVILGRAQHVLGEGPSAREAVARWLSGFVPFCSGQKGMRGCLSINAATDGAIDEAGIRDSIDRFNRALEQLLRDRLRADRAQFAAEFDPDIAAHAVMALYTGLMVLAKQAPDAARVRATIAQAMKLLA